MFLKPTKRNNKTRLGRLLKSRPNKIMKLNLINVVKNVPICRIWLNMKPNKVIIMRLWML